MSGLLTRLVAMCVTYVLFATLSMKLGWGKKIWSILKKNTKPQHKVGIWLIIIVVFNILVQFLLESFGLTYNEVISGAVLGFSLAWMPTLSDRKEK